MGGISHALSYASPDSSDVDESTRIRSEGKWNIRCFKWILLITTATVIIGSIVIAVALSLPTLGNAQSQVGTRSKVVIDTDVGLDDLFAISLLLQKHIDQEIEILGLTTVKGESPALEGAVTLRRLVKTFGITDITIYVGSENPYKPYTGHQFTESSWWASWGADTLNAGDLIGFPALSNAETNSISFDAFTFLETLVPTDVTFVTMGPLTNVAIAINQSEDFFNNFQQLVIMGGCLNSIGNAPNNVSEWNFYADSFAACEVLTNLRGQLTYMIGLDISTSDIVSKDQLATLLAIQPTTVLGYILKQIISLAPFAILRDPLSAAFVLQPQLFTFGDVFVRVLTSPWSQEGRLVSTGLDLTKLEYGLDVQAEGFLSLISSAMNGQL